MKKQVNAVIDEVKDVLGNTYDINVKCADLLSKDNIKTIQTNILQGLINGDIEYKGDLHNMKKLTIYANNLVINHLRKSKALNGNTTYTPSGTGPKRDERLRELNNLLKSGNYAVDTEEYEAIEEAIETRKQILASTKSTAKSTAKKFDIDASVLPTELQKFVDNTN